jgi:multidrug efflux pump subunit AcrA (membrane-fusion protein)
MKLKYGFLIAALGLSWLISACGGQATPTPAATPSSVSEATITAKGEVVPDVYARLAFNVGGTVSQLPVKEGQAVKKGNILALLDTTDLQLQVKSAQDALDLAGATLTQAKTPATPEEIAAAQASYDSAVAALDRTKKGPTQDELSAAQAAVNSALTSYNRAKNGPTADEFSILKSQLAKAKAALDQAQAAYDRIGGASNPYSALTPQALQLQQATQDYQIALANYNKAVNPDASTVAQAAAQLAQAQSNLQKLKDSPHQEDITQAQAQVDSAKAQLDLKKKGARPEDIAVAEKRVQQAQTAVDQAKSQLDKATLKAPLDGVVTDVTIREGELAQPGQVVITIADLSNLKVQTTDLDEFGAAKVKVGQAAKIRVNAFTDKTLTGKVKEVADQSVLLASGDVSYPVTVLLDTQDPDLRWGMTVKVEFQQ